ncbi:glycosyltransferase [Desertifilum sp. FACHB-1129]|uniref:Glycosyl transferase family 1 n=1 Tax=Desertifilum tharense IPPAS B-1220 TaxID=1781255 RepID=A0A1E5QEH0_9CYAN|nr:MULTISPECIES: glycosyltransferase family 4 protein [Desertifilum]MDA0209334.1 glycosyltransferase family 4 protein [Cyanobacteria bacterium FC1]MBD2315018.1 glycosyltransferase [Desertifilum sp. FACHB-1129]MBD2322867.1 glycosyltransferase [Desertifilum sp. FACHB-866]MBD2332739.1 glycosyltransferase [Desertifilum sp. FACHB-868]OEJ73048.1 glycosyl transferase family 1 [Desertifilum tharense IPPAS B-1220]
MNILMLSSTFPYPPSRGGTEIRTFNLMKYLHQRHQVTLVTQRHADVTDSEVEELRSWVSELAIFALPEQPKSQGGLSGVWDKVGRFTESAIKATPPNVLYRYSPEIQAWVDGKIAANAFNAVTCEHSVNEIYIRPEFRSSVRTVVNIHSSVYGWTRNHLEMGASPNPMRDRLYLSLMLERYEKRYSDKFTTLVVTTEDDRRQFLRFNPEADVQVIANGVDLQLFPYRSNDPGGHSLAFVGAMDASHNIDAARFFSLEVLPQLQQRYPDATFTIVGARPTPEVLELADCPGVSVTGKVESPATYLHASTVCVVPLRAGYGIKNKTLEAMACGTPVVGSDRALEGLEVDGADIPVRALRANRIEDYVVTISRLFEDTALRKRLSRNGRQYIEEEYTWERAGMRYEQVLSEC